MTNGTKMRSVSKDHSADVSGLSRQSALNDRYFEKPGRSRSLDNLLSPVSKLLKYSFKHSQSYLEFNWPNY